MNRQEARQGRGARVALPLGGGAAGVAHRVLRHDAPPAGGPRGTWVMSSGVGRRGFGLLGGACQVELSHPPYTHNNHPNRTSTPAGSTSSFPTTPTVRPPCCPEYLAKTKPDRSIIPLQTLTNNRAGAVRGLPRGGGPAVGRRLAAHRPLVHQGYVCSFSSMPWRRRRPPHGTDSDHPRLTN